MQPTRSLLHPDKETGLQHIHSAKTHAVTCCGRAPRSTSCHEGAEFWRDASATLIFWRERGSEEGKACFCVRLSPAVDDPRSHNREV